MFTFELLRCSFPACTQKDEADIYFLIDDSGSIEHDDFDDMRKFIIDFLRIFRIGQHHVRIGLAKYSTVPTLEFDLAAYANAAAVEEAVKQIPHLGGGTNTGKALEFMGPYFKQATRNVAEYLIVITDGESQDMVKAPAKELRAQGITIFAIGVKASNDTQLHEIADDPNRVFHVDNFDALKYINNKVFTEICAPEGEQHRSCNKLVTSG